MYEDLTVAEMRGLLDGLRPDAKLTFGGGLRIAKIHGYHDSDHVHVEFAEIEGFLSDEFKKRNPSVKVVFIDTDATEWDESGLVGQVDVNVR